MLLSLVLFGSRARGDSRVTSDVDLLGVIEGSRIHEETAINGASFYQYPLSTLYKMASSGDLFMLHLVKEAKILHDTASIFKEVCRKFEYKSSYSEEIFAASALMMYIISFVKFEEDYNLRKRLIWCVRTILIARSAERRAPVFSSKDLEDFSSIKKLKRVIDNRDRVDAVVLKNICWEVYINYGESVDFFLDGENTNKFSEYLMKSPGVLRSTYKLIAAKNQSLLIFDETSNEYI